MGVPTSPVRPLGSMMLSSGKLSGLSATTTIATITASAMAPPRQLPLSCWLRNPHPSSLSAPQLRTGYPQALTRALWSHTQPGPAQCAITRLGVRSAAGWTLPGFLCGPYRLASSLSLSLPESPPEVLRRLPTVMATVAAAGSTSSATTGAARTSSGGKPRTPSNKRQKQERKGHHTTDGVQQDDAVLFIGFHPEELDVVRQRLPKLLGPVDGGGVGSSGAATSLVDVTYDMLSYTVIEALARQESVACGAADSYGRSNNSGVHGGAVAVAAGRVVLLVGPAACGLGAHLNDLLAEWGVVPALIAAFQPKHEGMSLRQLVGFLRDSHAAYYSLLQPVRVESLLQPPSTVGAATTSSPTQADSDPAATAAATVAVTSDHWAVLEDVRVVMCAAMDAGEVASIHGHYRRDAGHLAVLDGLLTDSERRQLLDWLTGGGHDHNGPPPEDKWEKVCVDHEGAKPTWGLQPPVLQALRDHPPAPVVALQTRLSALYPEYDICHMPADQISNEYGNDDDGGDGTPLSSFVGNAVMSGDPCAWHVDADPTTVPPHSPWVHNFGYYHNRELGRPLFVSVVLYLNETWPEDYHAETLFLDPETQLGLFVRPSPGRVVLLEQDLPHRISAPSVEAPGPRYSLVWKLVFVPKSRAIRPLDGSGAGSGLGQERNGDRGVIPGEIVVDGEVEGEDVDGDCVARGAHFQSICRPEWGEPVRIGSANSRCGVKAFRRRMATAAGSNGDGMRS